MHISPLIAGSAALSFGPTARSPLYVENAPDHVRPYVIERYANAQAVAVGEQIYRFPVTGPSSGGAFSFLVTSAPESNALGVLPHIHERHYENFFCNKGSFQLWTSKYGDDESRVMQPGDYGAVPRNTTHTFQMLQPDTELIGLIQPGGFEDLFFAIADGNYTSSTRSPYVPSSSSGTADAGAGSSSSLISALEQFDVYAQLQFQPRRDLGVNGSAPANATWHAGKNIPPSDDHTPFYIAKNRGPMYLNSENGYQIIAPFQVPAQNDNAFSQGTITMDRVSANTTVPTRQLSNHLALKVLEGAVQLSMAQETVQLIEGDVAFIPGNETFAYWSEVSFAKVMYVSAGSQGLDVQLMKKAIPWDFAVWPTYGA